MSMHLLGMVLHPLPQQPDVGLPGTSGSWEQKPYFGRGQIDAVPTPGNIGSPVLTPR